VIRAFVVILVLATFVGAMMPARQASSADANEVAAPASGGWGSGEPEVAQASGGSGPIKLNRRSDGHFYADAKVDGHTIEFLVDTGASGVALAYEDATRAGIDVDPANFYVVGEGASGPVRGQVVRIDEVKLGHQRATHVSGIVMDGGARSLLGQSFLRQFGSVEIRGDTMTLR
jgi:aspartyl protease family protein